MLRRPRGVWAADPASAARRCDPDVSQPWAFLFRCSLRRAIETSRRRKERRLYPMWTSQVQLSAPTERGERAATQS